MDSQSNRKFVVMESSQKNVSKTVMTSPKALLKNDSLTGNNEPLSRTALKSQDIHF